MRSFPPGALPGSFGAGDLIGEGDRLLKPGCESPVLKNPTAGEAIPDFLQGPGEMAALIRGHDWASTPLGPPRNWSQTLKTAVRLLLSTQHPMFIWWGPDLIQFYNDAYRRSIGPERHPSAIGQKGRECWAEIWPIIGPQIEQVMSGRGPTWNENHLVPITRSGKREDVYWTYSYSPLDEADAPHGVGGVLVVCTETTQTVLAEKRVRAAQDRIEFRMKLNDALRGLDNPTEITGLAAEMLGRHLGVDQANYYTLDGDDFIVEREWHTPGTRSLIGRHHLKDFGTWAMEKARAGEVLRIDDTAQQENAPGFRAAGMAALVSMPLHHNGHWSAGLHVHQQTPRTWTDGEVALVRDVAERTWAEIERVHAVTSREVDLLAEKHVLEVLNRTGATIAAELDLDRVVQAVTDAGVELSGA